MLLKSNRDQILDVFFSDPLPDGGGFQLRELSRLTGIAPPSVKKYLSELEREGLILKMKNRAQGYPLYLANRDSENFRFLKTIRSIRSVWDSGLVRYLRDSCMPDAIVLYGSVSRGEDVKGSDMDLFVLSQEKKLGLARFDKALQRRVSIFFQEDFSSLSPELKNNVINGHVLYGYLKVF